MHDPSRVTKVTGPLLVFGGPYCNLEATQANPGGGAPPGRSTPGNTVCTGDLAAYCALGMSYRRAWLLVDDMNNCFREPVIAAQAGGSHGGGAALTPFGTTLIDQYRAVEAEAHSTTASRLRELEAACKGAQQTATATKSHVAPRRRTIAR